MNIEKQTVIENELLNIIYHSPEKIPKVIKHITKADFLLHGDIFEILVDCFKNNKNQIAEISHKRFDKLQFVFEHSVRDIDCVCKDLKQLSDERKIKDILEKHKKSIEEKSSTMFISDMMRDLMNDVYTKGIDDQTILGAILEFEENQKANKDKFKSGKGIIGISTGYDKLDNIIDGLCKEHLWIVAGYTNRGKTFAVLNIVSNLIVQNKRVVFYSLEMSKIQILSRLFGIMTDQNGFSVLKGYNHDEGAIEHAKNLIRASDFQIYNGKYELSDITFSMLEENMKKPVDLFVIDFIQNVSVKGSKTEYEIITSAILEFQQLARKLKTTVIVLSQVSNAGASGDSPIMAFKGSGALASAADFAVELVNTDDDNERRGMNGENKKITWDIKKNRHGITGKIDMEFNGKHGTFVQLGEKPRKVYGIDSIEEVTAQEILDF